MVGADRRWLALGGIAGPVGFVGAWALAGARRPGYSPVHEAISQLAAVGTPTRALMTAGFVAFGAGVPLYGWTLRPIGGWAWVSATAAGGCTLAVAALPLGWSTTDVPHAVAAVAGYVSLAATPLLAARPLAARGRPGWARLSTATGALSTAALAISTFGPAHGLWQRLGLTIADAWIVATATLLLGTAGSVPVRSVPTGT